MLLNSGRKFELYNRSANPYCNIPVLFLSVTWCGEQLKIRSIQRSLYRNLAQKV